MARKEKKQTIVDPIEGSVTIVKKDRRYPYGTELLMSNGFCIILFCMMFGLLPTTLYGSRLKHYRCSLAKFYQFVFGFCMIIMSIIFLPVSIIHELAENPTHGKTDTAVLILIKIAHICGFLFLLVRGYHVASTIPQIWAQLARLVQISVLDLHGKKYWCLKELKSYSRYAVGIYLLTMSLNGFNVFYGESNAIIPQFFFYYEWHLFEFTNWSFLCIKIGFFTWKLCSFSHMLVSILSGFLIAVVQVCLRSGNDHLVSLFEDETHLLINKRDKIKFVDKSEVEKGLKYLEAFNKIKNISVVAENVVGSISQAFGISLVVEILILIANLLVTFFYLLAPISTSNSIVDDVDKNSIFPIITNESLPVLRHVFRKYLKNDGDLDYEPIIPTLEMTWERGLTLLGEAFIHSYFFYKLCCKATEMANEAKEPLQILKSIPYDKYSKEVQQQIKMLKDDLASTNISMTASNFFQINKFAVTSIISALTTYVIVLLQFSQQDNLSEN